MFKGLSFFCKFSWSNDKRYIIYNILSQILTSTMLIISVAMPKFIIDSILIADYTMAIILISTVIGYNLIASFISNYLMMTVMTIRVKLSAKFDIYIHRKLAETDYENIESSNYIDMKQKADRYLYGDGSGFSYIFEKSLMIIGHIISLIGVAVIIVLINVYMIIAFLVLMILNALVENWAKKRSNKIFLEQVNVERKWKYYSTLFENFMYGKEIRINNLCNWFLKEEEAYANEVIGFYKKRNKYLMQSNSISIFVSFLQQAVACAIVLYGTIKGTLSVGDFVMFFAAVMAFSPAVQKVFSTIVDVKSYSIFYDALNDYVNIPAKMRSTKDIKISEGDHIIEFKDVSFKYPNQSSWALEKVNIKIEKNQKLSIVGENGAGKTTFIKLLMRLYLPNEGEILLDGVNINDYNYDEYMRLFSTVFQDYKLFSFSIKENIQLSGTKDGSNDSKILEILDSLGFDKINKLPDGIDTKIYKDFDDNGFEPSGGEGQKIALARAIYKDANIIILDEPTAALDPRAEYEIYQGFNNIVKNRMAIYISHRLSSTRFCDVIAVFKDGRIVEYGSHDELITTKGLYSELYGMQAQFYVDKT